MVAKDFECEVISLNQRKVEAKVVAAGVIGFDPKGQSAEPEERGGKSILKYGNDKSCRVNFSLNGCMLRTPRVSTYIRRLTPETHSV